MKTPKNSTLYSSVTVCFHKSVIKDCSLRILTLFRLGFLRVAQLGGGGGEGGVPAAYNSKTINDNEMKLGGVVKDH